MTLRKRMASGLGLGLAVLAAGACAQARPMADGRLLNTSAAGYELQVLVDGVPAPTFFHDGESYVMGRMGERYTLRVVNHTGRRIEAVVSVDGRDVVDGRAADYRNKRGYLVPAWGSVDIDGWRLSQVQAAAFRFSTVADSYAARTGSSREVGVIGAAVFPERYVPRPPPRRPLEVPYSEGWREPTYPYPRDKSSRDEAPSAAEGRGSSAPSAAPAPSSPSRSLAEAEASRRPGLGTEFGEAVGSAVREVPFVRANPGSPAAVLGARYNDRDGLVALGINVEPDTCGYDAYGDWSCDHDLRLRQTANPFPVTERRYAAPPPCWNARACR